MELGKNVRFSVHDSIDNSVRDSIWPSVSNPVHVSVRNPVFVSLWDSFNRSFNRSVWNINNLK